MKKNIKYLISKKTSVSIMFFAIICAVLYYNSYIMQQFIAENTLIQAISFSLIIIGIASIFFSTTLRKELNHRDIAEIVKKEQTSTKEIIKQIDKSKAHYNRVRRIGRKV
jgi:hypothetical protein